MRRRPRRLTFAHLNTKSSPGQREPQWRKPTGEKSIRMNDDFMDPEYSGTSPVGRGRPANDEALLERVSEQAQSMRDSFGRSRREYNWRVCDMLAAVGLAPNANLSLKAGRWGSLGDVQADVRSWYAELSKQKADEQIDIPAPARRRAADLIEQLFLLASQSSQLRLEERIAPLRQASEAAREQATTLFAQLAQKEEAHLVETTAAQAREAAARVVVADLENQVTELGALAEKAQVQASLDLQAARDHAKTLARTIDDERAQALSRERELERHIADLREATGLAQAKAAQDLLGAMQAAEGDRRALLRSIDEERQQHSALLRSLTEDLAKSRQRVEQLLVEMSSLTRQVNTLATKSEGLKQTIELVESPQYRQKLLDRIFESLQSSGLQLVRSRRTAAKGISEPEEKCDVGAAFTQAALRLAADIEVDPPAVATAVLTIARR